MRWVRPPWIRHCNHIFSMEALLFAEHNLPTDIKETGITDGITYFLWKTIQIITKSKTYLINALPVWPVWRWYTSLPFLVSGFQTEYCCHGDRIYNIGTTI